MQNEKFEAYFTIYCSFDRFYCCDKLLIVFFAACQPKVTTKPQASINAFKKGIAVSKDESNTRADTIKVLSWNLEHFIDSYDNPYVENRRENTGYKMENRVSLLVKALRNADADIVVLQEFEHIQFLK